jgi:hypothetical protein
VCSRPNARRPSSTKSCATVVRAGRV